MHAAAALVQDVGINHRGAHIAVPKKFLDRSDVVTRIEQMGREGMPPIVYEHGAADGNVEFTGNLTTQVYGRAVKAVVPQGTGLLKRYVDHVRDIQVATGMDVRLGNYEGMSDRFRLQASFNMSGIMSLPIRKESPHLIRTETSASFKSNGVW